MHQSQTFAAPTLSRAPFLHRAHDRTAALGLEADRWEGLLPWQIRRVLDYVETALHGPVSLSIAASHTRLSTGYFSRCFRRCFGVSFSRFVAGRRVERAQGLMMEGAGKLCHIALACGFADQAHFTRTFGSLVGCTPARWRRQAAIVQLSA